MEPDITTSPILEELEEDDESEMEAIELSTPPILEPSTPKQPSKKPASFRTFFASTKLKPSRFGCIGEGGELPGRIRAYQVWPGNNVFFFHGRLVCGPNPRGLLLTTVSIVVSSWVSSMYNVHDSREHSLSIRLVSVALAVIVLVNLFLASAFDPGIIPRGNQEPTLDEIGSSGGIRSTIVNRVEVKRDYCRVCKIYRPPRSCHCEICGNCVERFDHHCHWIGQCVGLRNYRRFLAFIFSAWVLFAYIFATSCWRIHARTTELTGLVAIVKSCPETLALSAFSFAAVWFLGSLVVFHFYLIAVNQTAYENFHKSYRNSANPYDRGIVNNVKEALFGFGPNKPCSSQVDFHAEIVPSSGSV